MQRTPFASGSATAALMAREKKFVRDAWNVGVRPDRRTFHQLREVIFEFMGEGVCLVKLGQSVTMCVVGCDLVEPLPFQPRHGMIEFSVKSAVTDSGAGTSTQLKYGKTQQCVTIAHILEALIKNGRVLSADGLCAVPGIKVWSIRMDCTILNDDGNALDATVLATLAALQSFRRPEISIRGEQVTVHKERDPIPLSLHHLPFTVTCALTELGDFVLDPSLAEAQAASGVVTVAVNVELQVCLVHKWEGADVSYPAIGRVLGAAKILVPQLAQLLKDAATEFETRQKEALKAQFLWVQQRLGVSAAAPTGDDDEKLRKKNRTE